MKYENLGREDENPTRRSARVKLKEAATTADLRPRTARAPSVRARDEPLALSSWRDWIAGPRSMDWRSAKDPFRREPGANGDDPDSSMITGQRAGAERIACWTRGMGGGRLRHEASGPRANRAPDQDRKLLGGRRQRGRAARNRSRNPFRAKARSTWHGGTRWDRGRAARSR